MGWIGGRRVDTQQLRQTDPALSHRRARTQPLVGSMSSLRERLMRVTIEAVGRGKIQAGCKWRGMMPNHTPKDRDETAWQGRS
jgi:hypothetical protein